MNVNKMTLNGMLLCCFLTILSSCQGQTKNTENTSKTTSPLGNVVSEVDKSIWVIFQDKKQNYWFGSNGKGVYSYDGKILKQFTTKDGLYSDQIRGIQEDKRGNLYFDTPNGVTKFDGKKFSALTPIKSPKNQWKLQPDDLWFKRNGDLMGACRYDGDTLYQLAFSDISNKEFGEDYCVYSIYKDTQGHIWFGTLTGGVCRFDGKTLNWIYEEELAALKDGRVPAIRSILEDKEGYFWFSNLLYQYKIQNNDVKTIQYKRVQRMESSQQTKMKLAYYTSAVVDHENIWMTNYNEGVWKYDGKNLTHYPIKNTENVLVVSLYKDNIGTLWLGTDNAGVYKFKDNTFEKFKP